MRVGLVNKVLPADSLIDEAKATARNILKQSHVACQKAKQAINAGEALSMETALELERNICAVCFSSPDRAEGMQAFVDKRKPEWKNEWIKI